MPSYDRWIKLLDHLKELPGGRMCGIGPNVAVMGWPEDHAAYQAAVDAGDDDAENALLERFHGGPLPVSDEPHDIVCVIVARHPMRTKLLNRDAGPLDA